MCGQNEGCQPGCGSCCGHCGGCQPSNDLYLTETELSLLQRFAQQPFWPVARRADDLNPVFLEGDDPAADKLAIQALEQKRVIRVDYDLPLDNFDYTPYQAYPHRGSMALTALGIEVLELLEVQGVQD